MKKRRLIRSLLTPILMLSVIYFCSTGLSFAQSDTGYQAPAGEMKKLADGIRLAGINADMFVPGHGKSVLSREQVASSAASTTEALLIMREEARKLFNKGMTYQEAAERIDYDKFKKWGDKDRLYGAVFGNLARAWS